MKNRKFCVILIVTIMVLIGGCGKRVETNNHIEAVVAESNTDTAEVNDTDTVEENNPTVSPAKSQEFNPVITEKDDSELNMKDYNDYLEDKTLCTDDNVFSSGVFEFAGEGIYFRTTEKVPMYASNGIRTGYIKEDIDFLVIATCEDWCYFYLNNDKKYARLSDIEANALTLEEVDAMRADAEEEAKAQAESVTANNSKAQSTSPTVQESVSNATVTEPAEVPTESDKYTPDEAISVYRSLMEAGGITWDSSLKDGGSWGTGWIYLDKGMPEWTASTNLESFAIGNHGGDSWTKYYLEVTGSDDECVYITEWHD